MLNIGPTPIQFSIYIDTVNNLKLSVHFNLILYAGDILSLIYSDFRELPSYIAALQGDTDQTYVWSLTKHSKYMTLKVEVYKTFKETLQLSSGSSSYIETGWCSLGESSQLCKRFTYMSNHYNDLKGKHIIIQSAAKQEELVVWIPSLLILFISRF